MRRHPIRPRTFDAPSRSRRTRVWDNTRNEWDTHSTQKERERERESRIYGRRTRGAITHERTDNMIRPRLDRH